MKQGSIVIAGCGNIGRRHLQALGGVRRRLRIQVQEVSAAARASAEEIARTIEHHDIEVVSGPSGTPETVDLLIVATNAGTRREAFEAVAARAWPTTTLFEKVLFTTRGDIEAVGGQLRAHGRSAYVNCGRRGFPGYVELRNALRSETVRSIDVDGARWGLCSNAVHFIDLAEFLTGSRPRALDASGVDPEPIEAKRDGCIELSGTLLGELDGGTRLRITCTAEDYAAPRIHIATDHADWHVDEVAGVVRREPRSASAGSAAAETRPFQTRYVSEMPYLYEELLDGRSRLPPYDRSAEQHLLLIDALRRRLGLSIEADEPCPIS